MNASFNKEHIKTLLRWLIEEVRGAGGDGDALWYSRYYTLDELLPILHEVNNEMTYKWQFEIYPSMQLINFGDGQEWLSITTNDAIYNSCPDYTQVKIKW